LFLYKYGLKPYFLRHESPLEGVAGNWRVTLILFLIAQFVYIIEQWVAAIGIFLLLFGLIIWVALSSRNSEENEPPKDTLPASDKAWK
jgi:hypothetical protein